MNCSISFFLQNKKFCIHSMEVGNTPSVNLDKYLKCDRVRAMKKFVLFSMVILASYPLVVGASYDMENFWTSTHDAPAWFEADGIGGFYGETVRGTSFSQHPVFTNTDIRLHKFAIEKAYFYISDRGIIQAEDDLRALSIYLSLS